MSNNYQIIEDNYLPLMQIESLRQYDNYQIYDLICVDIKTDRLVRSTLVAGTPKLKNGFLAVQTFSLSPITCDFIAIALTYK
jgi:hypothetical protein